MLPTASPNPFDPTATARSVHATLDEALAAIPPGHDGAFMLQGTEVDGQPALQALIATRIGANWSVAAGATWAGGTHYSAEVALMGSWSWPKQDPPLAESGATSPAPSSANTKTTD